ncbi:MAG: hypothetical protein V2A54_15650 [Bacteroidota bacterium]
MKSFFIILLFLFCYSGFAQKTYNCSCIIDTIDIINEFPEKMPEFPGGENARMKFLFENFEYPKEQLNDTSFMLQTKFYLSFVVDTNGRLRNRCIDHTLFPDHLTPAEQEALKLLDKMPLWIPAEHKGKKVAIKMGLPFHVELR